MRLAFSVAVNVDPDLLVIEEALAVGDGPFQKKESIVFASFRTAERLISAPMPLYVTTLCQRTLCWIADVFAVRGRRSTWSMSMRAIWNRTTKSNRGRQRQKKRMPPDPIREVTRHDSVGTEERVSVRR